MYVGKLGSLECIGYFVSDSWFQVHLEVGILKKSLKPSEYLGFLFLEMG